jgi:hypothetical protein
MIPGASCFISDIKKAEQLSSAPILKILILPVISLMFSYN